MKNILAITLLSTVIFGCSSTSTTMKSNENDKAYAQFIKEEGLTNEEKVNIHRFTGWTILSDNYLITKAGRNKNYLVNTQGGCLDYQPKLATQLSRYSQSTKSDINTAGGPEFSRTSGYDTFSRKSGYVDFSRKAGISNCLINSIHSIYSISKAQVDMMKNIGKSKSSSG